MEAYAICIRTQTRAYMRKEVVATSSLFIQLYTAATTITVSNVNTSGHGIIVLNQGIHSRNSSPKFYSPQKSTNQHDIRLCNANRFEEESDGVMFSFNVSYVVFDSLCGLIILSSETFTNESATIMGTYNQYSLLQLFHLLMYHGLKILLVVHLKTNMVQTTYTSL